MLLSSELAISLLTAWTADQNHPHKDRAKLKIPSQEEIELLLDTMFQVTLLKEEGESASCSVAWISKEEFIKNEIPKYRGSELSLYFDSPIEFTAKNLAKMSGISNGKTSALLCSNTGNNAEIWGICYFENDLKIIGSIPASTDCCRHFSPDCLTITTKGLGSLDVSRRGGRIGRIENGEFLGAHATVLSYDMLGKYLLQLISIEIEAASNRNCYKNEEEASVARTFLSCVEYLIEVLSQRKQSSAIIFVPDREKAKEYFDTSWGVMGSLEIDRLQENKIKFASVKESSGSLFELRVSNSLCNRLRNIADLAKMDGALLLTPDFNVLSFGAKLKAKKWEGKVSLGPTPYYCSVNPIDFKRLGTRHNSALSLVSELNGAVAFVASSDGPIRAITKEFDAENILYWPDCRESMFK